MILEPSSYRQTKGTVPPCMFTGEVTQIVSSVAGTYVLEKRMDTGVELVLVCSREISRMAQRWRPLLAMGLLRAVIRAVTRVGTRRSRTFGHIMV